MIKIPKTRALIVGLSSLVLGVGITTCAFSESNANPSSSPASGDSVAQQPDDDSQTQWQRMNDSQRESAINLILNRPLGIAALNQLAIEGFISPTCPKTFYTDSTGYQILLQVKCPDSRGVSTAVAYDEMRVILNRFEDNIENFSVERVSEENRSRVTPLP